MCHRVGMRWESSVGCPRLTPGVKLRRPVQGGRLALPQLRQHVSGRASLQRLSLQLSPVIFDSIIPVAELVHLMGSAYLPVDASGSQHCSVTHRRSADRTGVHRNWARRNTCNVCNTAKPGTVDVNREGHGGGFKELDEEEVAEARRRREEFENDDTEMCALEPDLSAVDSRWHA